LFAPGFICITLTRIVCLRFVGAERSVSLGSTQLGAVVTGPR
jgi:hypothetical protein